MPFTIGVETEKGVKVVEPVRDKDSVIRQLADAVGRPDVMLLGYVDAFGDTIFNRLQLPTVIQELDRMAKLARNESEAKVVAEVRGLAVLCGQKPHRYLKVYGD